MLTNKWNQKITDLTQTDVKHMYQTLPVAVLGGTSNVQKGTQFDITFKGATSTNRV